MPEVMTAEEKAGVEAIQFLQKMAGIDEDDSTALAGWRSLSNSARQTTISTFNIMKKVPHA